jgi:mannose-1-phosphate guanylyltransferase
LKGPELEPVFSHRVHRLARFVEKPDRVTAEQYVLSREYLWNSGIFVFTVETMLNEIQRHAPSLYDGLRRIEQSFDDGSYEITLEEVYSQVEAISIDYAVMEQTNGPVYVLPAEFGWNDVGSWQAVYELRHGEHEAAGNLVEGDGLLVDVTHSLVYSRSTRLIAVLGLDHVMIIDTPDALLVGDLRRSQEVRTFPEQLKKQGRRECY